MGIQERDHYREHYYRNILGMEPPPRRRQRPVVVVDDARAYRLMRARHRRAGQFRLLVGRIISIGLLVWLLFFAGRFLWRLWASGGWGF